VRQRTLIAGLLLITPWDRLEEVARHHYPLLPVRLAVARPLRQRGPPDSDRPAGADRHRRRRPHRSAALRQALYESLAEPKRLAIIEGADHNDWFDRLDDDWWRTGDRLPARCC
jgi:hypothetical protein